MNSRCRLIFHRRDYSLVVLFNPRLTMPASYCWLLTTSFNSFVGKWMALLLFSRCFSRCHHSLSTWCCILISTHITNLPTIALLSQHSSPVTIHSYDSTGIEILSTHRHNQKSLWSPVTVQLFIHLPISNGGISCPTTTCPDCRWRQRRLGITSYRRRGGEE